MGNNDARAAGTCAVWVAVLGLGIAALVNSPVLGGGPVILIVAILAVIGGISMQYIWGGARESVTQGSEKSKRRSRVDRMLEKMDEAELDELRTRLMSESDGEAVSLNELLEERERRKPYKTEV